LLLGSSAAGRPLRDGAELPVPRPVPLGGRMVGIRLLRRPFQSAGRPAARGRARPGREIRPPPLADPEAGSRLMSYAPPASSDSVRTLSAPSWSVSRVG